MTKEEKYLNEQGLERQYGIIEITFEGMEEHLKMYNYQQTKEQRKEIEELKKEVKTLQAYKNIMKPWYLDQKAEITLLKKQLKEKSDGIKLAIGMLNHVKCVQNCDGNGAIQISEDEWEQCQWCDELNKLKLLNNQ